MLTNLRKRLIRGLILGFIISAVREWSIRRHQEDLEAWPVRKP
ncbi:MAG: hypothetical protein P8L46_00950 [Acidimicrobiales bacterium]|nr:hypothetical protein [Acidimicrobiales bacterium]MDG2216592.1 hypothetical protein [Acidimicrobiales bacterium]